MKFFRSIWLYVLVVLLAGSAALATVPTISGFTTQQDGNTVTASLWNSQIGGIYNYINANLVTAFNTLTAKGDIFTFDGTSLQAQHVGANGTIPVADSTQTFGWRWGNIANVSNLSTKGDLLTYDGSLNQRLAVGSDGQVLTARSTAPYGVDWENGGVPSGCILLWSGALNTVPSGWHLCDGTSGTPNLQGLFVVGAGNTSPPASGGMGLLAPGGPSGDVSAGSGLGPSHIHSLTGGVSVNVQNPTYTVATVGATTSTSVTPRYYALAYIQKL